jgi:hypothetical protein
MNQQPDNSSGQGTMCGTASFLLATLSWLVVILTWGWVLTRPHGTFHDQGGLAITLIVLPLTLGAWLIGGPIALALGGRAMKRLGQGEADKSERGFAQTGVLLSRVLLWAGVAWLLISMLASVFR